MAGSQRVCPAFCIECRQFLAADRVIIRGTGRHVDCIFEPLHFSSQSAFYTAVSILYRLITLYFCLLEFREDVGLRRLPLSLCLLDRVQASFVYLSH